MAPWQNAREVQKIRGPNIDPKQQHPPSKYVLNHVETYPQHKEPHLKNNVKKKTATTRKLRLRNYGLSFKLVGSGFKV